MKSFPHIWSAAKMNEFGIVIYLEIYGIKDLRHKMKYQRNGHIFLNIYITEWNM